MRRPNARREFDGDLQRIGPETHSNRRLALVEETQRSPDRGSYYETGAQGGMTADSTRVTDVQVSAGAGQAVGGSEEWDCVAHGGVTWKPLYPQD